MTSEDHSVRLRVTNTSTMAIDQLIVMFPQEEIDFGAVPAGATTAYRTVEDGVYRYAAYRITIGNTSVLQPVVDWVGEAPIEGTAFTYELSIDPQDPHYPISGGVRRDE